jgi:hypothetical protein
MFGDKIGFCVSGKNGKFCPILPIKFNKVAYFIFIVVLIMFNSLKVILFRLTQ